MVLIGFLIFISAAVYILFFMRGKVVVEVVPTSAIVTLDNKPSAVINGSASFITKLGRHTLRVEADNYVGYKEEIDLKRGNNYAKKITLEKAPTPVEIAANAQHIAIKDNEIFYFNPSDRLFYLSKIDYSGDGQAKVSSTQAITSKPVTDFDNLIWSSNRELVAIKRGTKVSILDFMKYDFVHQSEVFFSDNVGDIVWSPDNSRLAYYYAPPGGEKSLVFSDAGNQNMTRAANLAELGINNPYLAFSPSSEFLAIIPRNQSFDQNKVYLMNIYSRQISTASNTGNQKEAVFSSDSQKVIYSTFSGSPENPVGQLLSVMNLDGNENRPLEIAARASSARLWSNPNQVFLPINSAGSKMILVTISSGQTSEFYFMGQGNSEISEIFLNNDKNGAIFVSSGKLYFVKLISN